MSAPAITKLGTALLEELMASIFQQKGRAVGKEEEERPLENDPPRTALPRALAILELGEPYFALVRKLQAQVVDLQEIVGKLRKDYITQEEEKKSKAGNLVARIMGRLGEQVCL